MLDFSPKNKVPAKRICFVLAGTLEVRRTYSQSRAGARWAVPPRRNYQYNFKANCASRGLLHCEKVLPKLPTP